MKRELNMAIFHIDHWLEDFDRWLLIFSEGDPRNEIERALELQTVRVLRDTEDPRHAIVIMRAATRDGVDRLIDNPRLQKRFQDRSLFASPPKVVAGFELTDLESYVVGENPAFFVDHDLVDFDKFKDLLMSRLTDRSPSDVKPIKLLHDIENRNHVRLVILATDKAALEHAMADAKLREYFANREIFRRPPEIVFSPTSVYP